jgi:KaiC domain protein
MRRIVDERVSTGVPGLDVLMNGGIPKGHAILYLGPPGAGKTTFGLAFIWDGLKKGERCVTITLEEDKEALIKTAAQFGWDFGTALKNRQLAVIKMDPTDLKGTTKLLRAEFPRILKLFGASRVLVDPLSVFELLFLDYAEKRQRIFELCDLVKRAGATAVYTAEANPMNPSQTRDGIIEYAVDGFVVLRYIEPKHGGGLKYAVRVTKLRRTDHSKDLCEYEITSRGPVVYPHRRVEL